MSNIVQFNRQQLDADAFLEKSKGQYKDFLIIGWNHDDELIAGSTKDLLRSEIISIIEEFKFDLLSGALSD